MRCDACGMCRVRLISSVAACSATAFGEYRGTRITGIPSDRAHTRSTLLKPAHRSSSSPTPRAASVRSTGALPSSFTKMHTASTVPRTIAPAVSTVSRSLLNTNRSRRPICCSQLGRVRSKNVSSYGFTL